MEIQTILLRCLLQRLEDAKAIIGASALEQPKDYFVLSGDDARDILEHIDDVHNGLIFLLDRPDLKGGE